MKIVENGKAVCGIIIPKEPTPSEAFAAEEMNISASITKKPTPSITSFWKKEHVIKPRRGTTAVS